MTGSVVALVGLALLAIALAWLVYRRDLVRCLREPVLRSPVLVFESDDWSPGEADQAQALAAIAAVLRRFRDRDGRHPKFALGVILAVPAVEEAADPGAYRRVTLADARMSSLRDVLRQGVEDGVFSLQLHGMEHFWPPAVLARAAVDPKVAQWLREGRFPQSEALPSELQSRWADARRLPSSEHARDETDAAVREEVAAFTSIFGRPPAVFVPPTFVWTDAVERAMAACGVRYLVTPGRRYVGRGGDGRPVPEAGGVIPRAYWNGRRLRSGLRALVRDLYFEPAYGHRAATVLPRIARHFALGRPALLETHRFNFVTDVASRQQSLEAVAELIAAVLERWPDVRFLSTEELAEAYGNRASGAAAFEAGILRRTRAVLARLAGRQWQPRMPAGVAAVHATLLVGILAQGISPA